jgi:hypothetical protein
MGTASTSKAGVAACALAATLGTAALAPARAGEFTEFDSHGLPGSHGIVVRVSHPSDWKKVEVDDEMALAELRGPVGRLTGILQIGRGRQRQAQDAACKAESARTMLQQLGPDEPGVRVTDVYARTLGGRAAYEVRYERNSAPTFMAVRSVIVCLKDSRLVVSCGGAGAPKSALAELEPLCRQVLESVSITED